MLRMDLTKLSEMLYVPFAMLTQLYNRIVELKPAYIRAHSQTISRLLIEVVGRDEPDFPRHKLEIYGVQVVEFPRAGFHELIFADKDLNWLGSQFIDGQTTRFPEGAEL